MTRTEHLLTILAEECNEVAHRCTKALRFGLEEIQPGQDFTNARRIVEELSDLFAAVDMLHEEKALPHWPRASRVAEKKTKVEHYLTLSASLGTLDPRMAKAKVR